MKCWSLSVTWRWAITRSVDLIRTIPARKVLVVGNHDLTREGLSRYERERNLFEAIVPFLYWPGLMGRLVFVSHYPAFVPNAYKGERVMSYHGHLHEKTMESNDQIKYFNVGWDVSHGLLCL